MQGQSAGALLSAAKRPPVISSRGLVACRTPRTVQMGQLRPAVSQKEVDLQQWPSMYNEVLEHLEIRGEGGQMVPNPLLERDPQPFVQAYESLGQEAVAMGVPKSALPKLAPKPTLSELREARDHLRGMMASFMSACI